MDTTGRIPPGGVGGDDGWYERKTGRQERPTIEGWEWVCDYPLVYGRLLEALGRFVESQKSKEVKTMATTGKSRVRVLPSRKRKAGDTELYLDMDASGIYITNGKGRLGHLAYFSYSDYEIGSGINGIVFDFVHFAREGGVLADVVHTMSIPGMGTIRFPSHIGPDATLVVNDVPPNRRDDGGV